MVVACQFNQWPIEGKVVKKRGPNGGSLEMIEASHIQTLCKIAYDIVYNQELLGTIMMVDFDCSTQQEFWQVMVDGEILNQTVPNENAALDLLVTGPTAC